MHTPYEVDVVAWAYEQASLLRDRRLALIDIEHIAEEIVAVGKREKRELASRLAVLLAHLLKWRYQPERRGASWRNTIRVQRRMVVRQLKWVPSLLHCLDDPEWLEDVWDQAVVKAEGETGLAGLPDSLPWTLDQILSQAFYPE